MKTLSNNLFCDALALQIRSIREERGLTQEAVAEMLGMHRSTIGFHEQGRRVPRIETLVSMSNLYEIDFRMFFSFLDAMYATPGIPGGPPWRQARTDGVSGLALPQHLLQMPEYLYRDPDMQRDWDALGPGDLPGT